MLLPNPDLISIFSIFQFIVQVIQYMMKCTLVPIPGESEEIINYLFPTNFAGKNNSKNKVDIGVTLLDRCYDEWNSQTLKKIRYNWVYEYKLNTEASAKKTQIG
jgi:hypothetical protein